MTWPHRSTASGEQPRFVLAATLVVASPEGAREEMHAQLTLDGGTGAPDGSVSAAAGDDLGPTTPAEESRASGDAGTPEAPLVGETVVTASRAPRLRSEVPADVTVLDRADLEQSASPLLDDVLRRVPDVGTFRRSSSRVADPSSQGLNLRGVGPSAVSRALVLVDGLPLNDPFGGWVYWQSVPGLSIGFGGDCSRRQLGALRDPALGGVVNIRSRPLDVPSVEADVFGDTLPSLGIGLRGVQRAGPVAVELTSEFLGSNGYNVVAPEQRGAVDVPAGSTHVSLQGRMEAGSRPTSSWDRSSASSTRTRMAAPSSRTARRRSARSR